MRLGSARTSKPTWAIALEEYDDFGRLGQFRPFGQQAHQLYVVVDNSAKAVDIEMGIGAGLTSGSDKLTLKLILSRDLNKGRAPKK